MLKSLNRATLAVGAAFIIGLTTSNEAQAGNNFSSIASNITDSISNFPQLISALSYLFGLVMSVLGIMKIKDHVENPSQSPLKEGAIRLAAGGALFALPIVTEAMFSTIGDGAQAVQQDLDQIDF